MFNKNDQNGKNIPTLAKQSKVVEEISEIDTQKNPEIATVPSNFVADTVCTFSHVGILLHTFTYLSTFT